MRLLALMAVVLVAGSSVASARRASGQLVFTVDRHNSGGEVEQHPGTFNPTACLWDVDNIHRAGGVGYLDAGASVADSYCLIADNALHITGVRVRAKSPGLVVTLRYEPHAVTFTMTARPLDREYEYRGCVTGPFYGSDVSVLPEIPGSNGGHGVHTQITVTVTNPTGKRVRDVLAQLETGSHGASPTRQAYCFGEQQSMRVGSDPAAAWWVAV